MRLECGHKLPKIGILKAKREAKPSRDAEQSQRRLLGSFPLFFGMFSLGITSGMCRRCSWPHSQPLVVALGVAFPLGCTQDCSNPC